MKKHERKLGIQIDNDYSISRYIYYIEINQTFILFTKREMVLCYLMNKCNFRRVEEIELRGKKYKSEYNYDYYYNHNENVLVLEQAYEDYDYSEYTLINHKGEHYLGEGIIGGFDKADGNSFEIYNSELWR